MAQPSGGLAGAVLWPMFSVNQFQGTKIPEGEKMDAAVRQVLPNWGGNIGEMMEAATGNESYALKKERRAEAMEERGMTRHRSSDDYSPATAVLSNAGIRMDQLDVNKMKRRIKWKYDQRLREKKQQLGRLKRKVVSSDRREIHRREIDNLQADIRRIKKNRQKALRGGE